MPNGDKGNPNVFTTFQGRYTVDVAEGAMYGSKFVMLSCINDVIFLADCTANADGSLITLPEPCRPSQTIKILAPIQRAKTRATQQIEVVTNVTADDKSVVTDGTSSSMNYIESTTSETHKALTDIVPVFNTGMVSTLGDGVGQANGLQLTEGSFTALTKATTKSTTVVNKLTKGAVKSIVEVQKTKINIGTDEYSLPYSTVTINPDGTVIGEANSTYYMNGISFNISGNFYR